MPQYAEFLNAKAASDPHALYNPNMGSYGITRNGSDGSYTYTLDAGFENNPVGQVSFWSALRFANWLHNGQGSGDTKRGAYTITAEGIANNTITRNPDATTFLPSENEWYKAAYYSPGGVYFEYPMGTYSVTGCVPPAADTGNSANCSEAIPGFGLTDVGAYGLSNSPYGTFDQGGNVWEWNEEIHEPGDWAPTPRDLRGGSAVSDASALAASGWHCDWEFFFGCVTGIRVASLVPEPGTSLLMMTSFVSLLGMALRGRRRS